MEDWIWIDAISINQSDPAEKSSQVAMMRDIFTHATRVIVWTGPESDEVGMAFDLLNRLHDCVKSPLQDNKYGQEDLSLQQNSLPLFEDPQWRALWHFLSRTMFTRVWIVQELVVYASSTTICGNLSIDTDVVLAGTSVIRYFANVARACESQVSEQTRAVLNNGHVISMLRRRRLEGAPLPFTNIVSLTKYHRASDEMDMIFALVGIASDQPVALIDYTDSLRTCIVQYGKYGLLKPKEYSVSLDMLSNVSGQRPELKLPSWVPDIQLSTYGFRPLGTTFCSSHLEASQYFRFEGETGEVRSPYHPCSGLPRPYIVSDVPKQILVIYGYQYDTVQTTVPSPLTLQPQSASTHASKLDLVNDTLIWESKCREAAAQALKGSSKSSELPETYWRCLVFDLYQFTRPAPAALAESFMSWYQLLLHRKERFESSETKSEEEQAKGKEPNESLFINAIPFMEGLQQYGMGRCFMTTMSGRIGWGPQAAVPGDSILTLRGCRIPFVFRRGPHGTLSLLGDAYVQGHMDYEAGTGSHANFEEIWIA